MNWHLPPEQIRQALSRAPQPIREFIVEGELVQIAQKIAAEHRLHVDATGMLVQLMTAVLLGFLDPALLPSEVSRLGVEADTVSRFISDLNTQIFIPLQKRVKEAGHEPNKEERVEEGKSFSSEPAPAPERPASFRTPPPAPVAPPPAVSAPVQPAQPIPQSPTPAQEAPVPSYNLVGSVNANPQSAPAMPASAPMPIAPMPTMRTMQHDIDALQHGQVPTPFPTHLDALTPSMPSIAQATPARGFQTASVPFTSAPQRPAPVQVPSMPVPPPPATRPLQPQAPQAPQGSFVQPPPTGTSTDPYREPI